MKRILTLVFLLVSVVLTIACSSSNGQGSEAALNQEPDGEKIFKTNCVICHGIKGNLQLNGAKVLGESELSLEERILVIKNGRNTMTPFGGLLSDEEIEAVAKYTFTFSDSTDVE